MVSYSYCMFAVTGEASHFILFLFLFVAFPFQHREVPLKLELVWWFIECILKRYI